MVNFVGIFIVLIFSIFSLSLVFQQFCISRIRKIHFENEKKINKKNLSTKDKIVANFSLPPFTIFFLCLMSEKERLEKNSGFIPKDKFQKSKRDARICLFLTVLTFLFFSIIFTADFFKNFIK